MPRGWFRVSGNGTSFADPSGLTGGLAPDSVAQVIGGTRVIGDTQFVDGAQVIDGGRVTADGQVIGGARVKDGGRVTARGQLIEGGRVTERGHVIDGGRPTEGTSQPASPSVSRVGATSLALSNLRAVVILIVVAFHSALAYLAFLGPTPFAFDAPPYEWRAFPIVDSHRWFGFDIFCAWQDVYLMAFMFFLSALFTWPSLTRKGPSRFLADRFLRLGVPFLFAVIVVVPLALYPTYAVSAANPGIADYIRHYLALPFLPNGPEWFLWQLLALTVVAAALHRFAPGWVAWLARVSTSAGARPVRYFAGLVVAAAVAYVPLALGFTPMAWIEHGPLGLHFSRPLLYAVFYFAGLGLGAFGLGRGLLTTDGRLARDWPVWLAAAVATCVAWMGLTAWGMRYGPTAPIALRIAVDASFALACASGCFCVLAASLRFGARRSAFLDGLSSNAFAIYLLHYAFVVWMQYALLGAALPGSIKGTLVFAVAVSLSWCAAAVLRHVPFGARLIGEDAPSRSLTPRIGGFAREYPHVEAPVFATGHA